MKETNERDETRSQLDNHVHDGVTSLLRIAVGYVPVVGTVLSELVAQIRCDRAARLETFVLCLNDELNRLGETQARILIEQESIRSLIQLATDQYCRADSDMRREFIKKLMLGGLTAEVAEVERKKYLLNIIEKLPDPAIIILAVHCDERIGAYNDTEIGDTGPKREGAFKSEQIRLFYESYRQTLTQYGLLERLPNPKPVRTTKGPELSYQERLHESLYDKRERDKESKITEFGRQLLIELGLSKDPNHVDE